MILVNTLARLASCAPLRYMMFLNCAWPAISARPQIRRVQRQFLPHFVWAWAARLAWVIPPIWQSLDAVTARRREALRPGGGSPALPLPFSQTRTTTTLHH